MILAVDPDCPDEDELLEKLESKAASLLQLTRVTPNIKKNKRFFIKLNFKLLKIPAFRRF